MHALVQGAFEHEPKHATNAGAHVLCVAGVQWQAVSVHVKSAPMKTDSFDSVTCELANVTPPRGGSSKPLATAALTSCHTLICLLVFKCLIQVMGCLNKSTVSE